jgi:glycosyltransferase involved in cell wall biosynthesis
MSFELSVVIPTLRKSNRLNDCVHSICRSAEVCGIKTEVLIIDNSNNKKPLAPSKFSGNEFSRVEVLRSKQGVNIARNKGLTSSQADVVLLIDDDCVLSDELFLTKHIDFHSKNKTALACGGFYQTIEHSNSIDLAYVKSQNEWLRRGFDEKTKQANYLLGGNLSVKKKLLLENNLFFDENIKYGGSETEFFVRTKAAGFTCFVIDAVADHLCEMNLINVCVKSFKQGYGKKYRETKFSFEVSNRLYIHKSFPINSNKIVNRMQSFFFSFGYRWCGLLNNGR